MAKILKEIIKNRDGVTWLRTHGVDPEGSAICSNAIHTDIDGVEEGLGQISCPDCIRFIEACKAISESDFAPEYENELFNKRF